MAALEELFSRFCERGDVAALGEFYDRTANEVLRVALFLTRRASDAEDLVQATYLAAIEGAAGWDVARPVLPWLLGILANQARWQRRREARTPPVPERREPEDPREVAAAIECSEQVDAAVAALPELYRPVLHMALGHGMSAPEIAHVLGRPPATIRTQLARGLELLRKVLPPSLALSAAFFAVPTRGLAFVKQTVLAHAGGAPVASLGAVSILGGMLVVKKSVAALVALALLGMLGWLALVPIGDAVTGGERVAVAAAPLVVRTPDSVPQPTPVRDVLTPSTRPAATTGSLLVRVVWDSDGAPAVGVGLTAWPATRPNWPLEPIFTTTDARGEVLLPALEPGEIYLALDRCDTPNTLVRAGERTTFELRIPRGVEVAIVAVDPEGHPVAGARVCTAESGGTGQIGREIASTDAQGRCTLRDVAPGTAISLRARGFGPTVARVAGEPGSRQEMRFVLGRGARELDVLVLDANGKPCPGVHVRLGHLPVLVAPERPGSRDPCHGFEARTGPDGMVHLEGLPAATAHAFAIARGQGAVMQDVDLLAEGAHSATLRLSGRQALVGAVRDERGAPIVGAQVRVNLDEEIAYATQTTSDGALRLEDLPSGRHEIAVSAKGFRSAEALVTCAPPVTNVDVTLTPTPREERILGRVLDEAGAPLVGWHVFAMATPRMVQAFCSAISGADGRFVLGDCAEGPYKVSVTPPGDATWRVAPLVRHGVWRGGPELEFRVARTELVPRRIRATIVDAQGMPLPESGILFGDSRISSRRSILPANEDGTIEIGAVPAGGYGLAVCVNGVMRLDLGWRTVAHDADLDLGRLVVPELGRARITLDGPPLGANSEAAVLDGAGMGVDSLMLDKSVVLTKPLAPGRYGLHLGAPGFANGPYAIEVQAGATTECRVTPIRGVTTTLRFLPESGRTAWAERSVEVRDAAGRRAWCGYFFSSERNPTQRATPCLVPGDYECIVTNSAGVQVRRSWKLDAARRETHELVIDLP